MYGVSGVVHRYRHVTERIKRPVTDGQEAFSALAQTVAQTDRRGMEWVSTQMPNDGQEAFSALLSRPHRPPRTSGGARCATGTRS
jgi:hypothetical protein